VPGTPPAPLFPRGSGEANRRPCGPSSLPRPRTRHSRPFLDGAQDGASKSSRPGTPAGSRPLADESHQDLELPQVRPGSAAAGTAPRPSTPTEEPCGLTPASLKHLRRQRDTLSEDKERLLAEIERLQRLLREQRDRVSELESATPAASPTHEPTDRDTQSNDSDELKEAWASSEARLQGHVTRLEKERLLLEQTLERRDAELGRLNRSMQDQIDSSNDQRHTMERAIEAENRATRKSASMADRVQRLEAEFLKIGSQKGELEKQLDAQKAELEKQLATSQEETAESVGKLDTVTKMYEEFKQQVEQLRTGLVGTAIQSKLELHISVPHVVLTYNNAPALTVSTAMGLSKAKILKFLDNVLFPHFEPLWVCLDGVDKAPDGTNKKKYSSRMLERLTDSIKDFIEKSQLGEEADLGSGGGKIAADPIKEAREAKEKQRPGSRENTGFKGLGSLRNPGR